MCTGQRLSSSLCDNQTSPVSRAGYFLCNYFRRASLANQASDRKVGYILLVSNSCTPPFRLALCKIDIKVTSANPARPAHVNHPLRLPQKWKKYFTEQLNCSVVVIVVQNMKKQFHLLIILYIMHSPRFHLMVNKVHKSAFIYKFLCNRSLDHHY